jgi:hypothetical protein
MNTVSMRGLRWRFMRAIWNSYSKSEMARRPRTITVAPIFFRVVHEQARERVHLDPRLPREGLADDLHPLLHREERLLLGLRRMAMVTSSNTLRPRAMMSRWPFVIGSNEPG